MRGDVARPTLGPLSEAQWTALALVAARVTVEVVSGPEALVRTAALAVAAIVVLGGYVGRGFWLDLPPPSLDLERLKAWEAALAELNLAAVAGFDDQAATAEIDVEEPTVTLQVSP